MNGVRKNIKHLPLHPLCLSSWWHLSSPILVFQALKHTQPRGITKEREREREREMRGERERERADAKCFWECSLSGLGLFQHRQILEAESCCSIEKKCIIESCPLVFELDNISWKQWKTPRSLPRDSDAERIMKLALFFSSSSAHEKFYDAEKISRKKDYIASSVWMGGEKFEVRGQNIHEGLRAEERGAVCGRASHWHETPSDQMILSQLQYKVNKNIWKLSCKQAAIYDR